MQAELKLKFNVKFILATTSSRYSATASLSGSELQLKFNLKFNLKLSGKHCQSRWQCGTQAGCSA